MYFKLVCALISWHVLYAVSADSRDRWPVSRVRERIGLLEDGIARLREDSALHSRYDRRNTLQMLVRDRPVAVNLRNFRQSRDPEVGTNKRKEYDQSLQEMSYGSDDLSPPGGKYVSGMSNKPPGIVVKYLEDVMAHIRENPRTKRVKLGLAKCQEYAGCNAMSDEKKQLCILFRCNKRRRRGWFNR